MLEDLQEILKQSSKAQERRVLLFGASRLSGLIGHLVALEMLQGARENGLSFDTVYGSHLGAIFAAMYAHDVPGEDSARLVMEEMADMRIFDWRVRDFLRKAIRLSPFNLEGMCYGKQLGKILQRIHELAATPDPQDLHIFAEHLELNRLKRLAVPRDVDVVTAMRAATAVTAFFPPVEIDGERFVDSGLFGGLPLKSIYNHQKQLTGKRKPAMTIVAFQQAFLAHNPNLSLTNRLVYSFSEKVRYHSALIDIAEMERLPVRLILISFHAPVANGRGVTTMSAEEKERVKMGMAEDISRQLQYYESKLRGKRRKCDPYPFTR